MTTRKIVMTAVILALGMAAPTPADEPKRDSGPIMERAAAVRAVIDKEYDGLTTLYTHLHSHPELSYQEVLTSARLAKEMKELGFEVAIKVGGHGIVCVYKNGAGPTVLVRTDMDALPVTEKTGVPYASKVRVRDKAGNEVGVMHACGHDMHMTCWVGTAKTLLAMKDRWKGTLVSSASRRKRLGPVRV